MVEFFEFLRKVNFLVGLKKDYFSLKNYIRLINRQSRIDKYLKLNDVKKLHIGSNISLLDGWLCSDISPQTKESIYLDATNEFPFENESLDYVYSEHMIEHISRASGLFMLKECFRVLAKNGKIRIATPDVEKIVSIYSKKDESFGNDYVKWITDTFIPDSSDYNPLIVLNTMFRNWSHVFLYDAEFLENALKEAGFSNIIQCNIGESSDINLQGIEKHHLNVGNLEMVAFETMIFEATKL